MHEVYRKLEISCVIAMQNHYIIYNVYNLQCISWFNFHQIIQEQ